MEYEDFLKEAQINGQLDVTGLNTYISILRCEILDLKQKIIDLEFEIQKYHQDSIKSIGSN